jgi:hypothetical protein
MIGKSYTIKLHETSATTVDLDSVVISEFSHEASLVAVTTSINKEDFPGDLDTWRVKVAYPATLIPATSTTLAALLKVATDAINAKFVPSEIVSL